MTIDKIPPKGGGGGAAAKHATEHVTGGEDVIANAVPAGNAGLMSGTDKTKLNNTKVIFIQDNAPGGQTNALWVDT